MPFRLITGDTLRGCDREMNSRPAVSHRTSELRCAAGIPDAAQRFADGQLSAVFGPKLCLGDKSIESGGKACLQRQPRTFEIQTALKLATNGSPCWLATPSRWVCHIRAPIAAPEILNNRRAQQKAPRQAERAERLRIFTSSTIP